MKLQEMAGTSATYIETHYKHYDDEMLKTTALKSFQIEKSGIVFTEYYNTPFGIKKVCVTLYGSYRGCLSGGAVFLTHH